MTCYKKSTSEDTGEDKPNATKTQMFVGCGWKTQGKETTNERKTVTTIPIWPCKRSYIRC